MIEREQDNKLIVDILALIVNHGRERNAETAMKSISIKWNEKEKCIDGYTVTWKHFKNAKPKKSKIIPVEK